MGERDRWDTLTIWLILLFALIAYVALFTYGDHQLIRRLEQRVDETRSE